MTALPADAARTLRADAPGRVMLVDDHGLLAASLAALLRGDGFDVAVEEPDAPEALLERARGHLPDVVLLDLDLGREDLAAVDLIPGLREQGARVVMLSGSTDRVALAECLEAGAEGILSKATPFADVVEAIGRAVAGRTVTPPAERDRMLDLLRAERRARRDALAPFDSLTPKEAEVLASLAGGLGAEAIAEEGFVSITTVRSQIRGILTKLGVSSQLAAVALAARAGWTPPPPARP